MTDAQPNLHRRRLGAALRGLREAKSLSLTEAAEMLGINKSALSKIENGKQRVPPISLAGYFEAYECTGSPRANQIRQLATMASSGKRSNLLDQYGNVVPGPFAQYLNMEELASKNDTYSLVVPGLLQTEDYARALVGRSHRWRTKKEVSDLVELRMARQDALRRDAPLQVWCVLDEAALRRQVGGSGVMRAQLEKLASVTEDAPNVAIQVLPFSVGPNAGIDGPFHVLYFPAGPPLVVVEPMTSSLYLEEEKDVELYETAFNHLRAEALDVDKSRLFIREIIKDQS
ncbi:helix-turn-helix domain-containing protein [Streptomyces sp. NPDC088252]|uniref:helix-turn-helix domain-containing protein n=1 Tax=Streptomyces sp. NPDC088252 TaxID=3365845 RepID=UPI00380513C8